MFNTRRVVAVGVKICTGFAAPSKIGPIVTLLPDVAFNRLNEMFAASRFGMINKFAEPLKLELGNAE